jgi:hypothetical protein
MVGLLEIEKALDEILVEHVQVVALLPMCRRSLSRLSPTPCCGAAVAMEETGWPGLAGPFQQRTVAVGEVGRGHGDDARGRPSSSSTPAGRPDARVPAGAARRGRGAVVGRRRGRPARGRPFPASAVLREDGAAALRCRRRNRGVGEEGE